MPLPPPVTKTQIYKQARLHLKPPTNKIMMKAAQKKKVMKSKYIFQHPPHTPSHTYDQDLPANDKAQTIMYEDSGACGKKCNEDNDNIEECVECECLMKVEEKENNEVYDFRTMPSISMSSRSASLKRLKEGPKKAKLASAQKARTGIALGKLMERIAMTIPDIWVGEHSRNRFRNKKRPKIISPNPGLDTICEDQCLVRLERMSIHKSTKVKPEATGEPVSKGMDEMRIEDEEEDVPEDTREMEDFWEDFSNSEEEQEALHLIAEAEVELMKEYETKQKPGERFPPAAPKDEFNTPEKVDKSMNTPSPPSSKKRRMPVKKISPKMNRMKTPASRRITPASGRMTSTSRMMAPITPEQNERDKEVPAKMTEHVRQTSKVVEVATKMTEQIRRTDQAVYVTVEITEQSTKTSTVVEVAAKMNEQVSGQVRQTDKGVEVATKMTEQGRQTSKVVEVAPKMTEQPGKAGTSGEDPHLHVSA